MKEITQNRMSDREKLEMESEEAKETDTRTELTSMEETEGQDTDLGTSESDWRHERDPRSSNETQTRHELDQSSEYHPLRAGVADCYYYLKNGSCFFGRSCRFNHPPRTHDTMQPSGRNCRRYLDTGQCIHGSQCWFNHPPSPYPDVRDCRQYLQTGECSYGPKCRFNHPSPPPPTQSAPFFQKGSCKYGSECRFTHSTGEDGAEPMRQATTWGKNFHEKKHGAKSRSRPWKRVTKLNRYMQGYDLDEQKQKKMKVEHLRIDVQSGEGGSQTAQRLEIPENPNVIAQENQQEQADMEGQNREAQEKAEEERRQLIAIDRTRARLRLERMRPRVLTDNVDQVREVLPDIGIDRKEGDGF
ncbi:unnamed protein product [Eruca vesicaria subsp. sativa]|uniref:C3H1-type domain-containing protein n=1 Tax=Eruca vesicaria subsp. sativa TaxID=29727 RepID=A0ABC8IT56_ERUVS|nr:unnamed protein product [Eruca vesicaria subsp. sativa]